LECGITGPIKDEMREPERLRSVVEKLQKQLPLFVAAPVLSIDRSHIPVTLLS